MIAKQVSIKKISAVIALGIYTLSIVATSVLADSEFVSYLSSPPFVAQSVELEQIQTFQGQIVEVPGVPIGNGEVLQAQASTVCSGLDVSSGTYVCSEFSGSTEVSQEVVGHTFSKRCSIEIIEATYPAFYAGVLANNDARVDYKQGEAPALAHITGNVNDVDEINGEKMPGQEFHHSNAIHNVPNTSDVSYHDVDGSSMVETYAVATSPNAQNEAGQGGNPVTVGDCEPGSTMGNPNPQCDNLNKATKEWEAENPWWCQPNADCTSRPIEQDSTCPNIELVGGERSCYQPLHRPIINISGFLSDLECLLTNNCYENVQLMIWTDPLMGKNNGCIPPCGDMQADAQVAATHVPDQTRSCTSNNPGIGGQNAPCWDDRYVGTWGRCSVCNREVPCMFVWKNTLYDEYERMKAEQGPCDPGNGDMFCTFYNSDYDNDGVTEEGYFPYIVRVSGGSGI